MRSFSRPSEHEKQTRSSGLEQQAFLDGVGAAQAARELVFLAGDGVHLRRVLVLALAVLASAPASGTAPTPLASRAPFQFLLFTPVFEAEPVALGERLGGCSFILAFFSGFFVNA